MSIFNFARLKKMARTTNLAEENNELVKKGWAQPLSRSYATYYTGNGQVIAYRYITSEEIRQNYKAVAPLNTAVSYLADTAASMPLTLENRATRQYLHDHPVFDLFDRPNMDYQKTKRALFKALLTWKILEGDAFLILTGDPSSRPAEIYVPAPSTLRAEIDPNTGYVARYIHETHTQQEIYTRDPLNDRFFNRARNRELYHITGFTTDRAMPGDRGINGESDIQSLYYEINQYMHAGMHNLSLLSNGARPSGAFVLKTQHGQPATLTEEQYERLKHQMRTEYTGSGNAGNPLLLDGGLEWQDLGMSPKDLDFGNLRKSAESAIYHKIGVPKELLEPSTTTAGNLANIRLEFYENRVLPLLEDLLDHLSNTLLPRYRGASKLRFAVDRDRVDVLIPARVKQRELIENSLVMTLNEKREHLHMDSVEGGNKVVDPNGRPIAGPDAGQIVGEEASATPDPAPEEESDAATQESEQDAQNSLDNFEIDNEPAT